MIAPAQTPTIINSTDISHWHNRFLELAAHIAQWSRDPRTKVGAVITRPDKTIASLGFNGFARGIDDAAERYDDRLLKNEMVVHAEMNAILHAREPLHDYTLYVWPFAPCARCAVAIIQSGIKTVYTVPKETENWKASLELSLSMFDEAGVKLHMIRSPELETKYNWEFGQDMASALIAS